MSDDSARIQGEHGHSIQFTFSPVQSFVAQARKTRDLWAGSYLLSYLAGAAMLPIQGYVTFPCVDEDPLMRALSRVQQHGSLQNEEVERPGGLESHLIGSLPNRFQADGEDPEGLARKAQGAFFAAWRQIAEGTWECLSSVVNKRVVLLGPAQKELWERQTENLWEVLWVVGSGLAMEERKQWRIIFPPPEPGERCTLCGEREAISPSGGPDRHVARRDVRNYWKELASAVLDIGQLFEPDGSERLCAICTIKRLLPEVAREVVGYKWRERFPSTPHIAARDWIRGVMQAARDNPGITEAAKRFVKEAEAAGVGSEKSAQGLCLEGDMDSQVDRGSDFGDGDGSFWNTFKSLNGHAYFPESIKTQPDLMRHPERRRPLLRALLDLGKLIGSPEGPSPYYALLVMDGDWMGALLSKHSAGKQLISRALSAFSHDVPAIVYRYAGETVYAGGDDVLALLPMGSALKCALEVRNAYLEAFRKVAPGIKATISAAIVFAHMNSSLQQVVAEAHRLLDREAKDITGRDAFAIRIWRRGGPDLTFSRPWGDPAGDGVMRPTSFIEDLERFALAISREDYSSKFLYKLREIFQLIWESPSRQGDGTEKSDGGDGYSLSDQEVEDIMVAEYLDNRNIERKEKNSEEARKKARERVKLLLRLSRRAVWEDTNGGARRVAYAQRIEPDAFMLARFLAHKEV